MLALQATPQDLSPGSHHQEVGCAPSCALVAPASLWLAGVCDPVRLYCTCCPPVLLHRHAAHACAALHAGACLCTGVS